jgi:hypothetical protein
MIQDLIDKTNTEEFYQNCDLKLESYNYITSNNKLELLLSINQISYDYPVEYEEWKITCNNTKKLNGFFWDILMPYVKLKILNNHPLLWQYHEDELECEIIGIPKNVNEFIGDISNELEKKTGNWIAVNQYFWNSEEYYKKYSKRNMRITESLKPIIKQVCEKHNLSFKAKTKLNDDKKGYANKSKSKILIFGNEDVSPNNFNFNQPYIIAESFVTERIK